MKTKILMMGAAALAFVPGIATAAPGGNGANGATHTNTNLPSPTTGQPSQDCVDLVTSGDGAFPGNATSSPGSAFNEDPGGVAGSVYAGERPQNSKISTSVSQYDVACSKQAM